MKGFLVFPILLILLFGTPSFADVYKGWKAYDSGDYVTALNEFIPLAEHGDADAQCNARSLKIRREASQSVVKFLHELGLLTKEPKICPDRWKIRIPRIWCVNIEGVWLSRAASISDPRRVQYGLPTRY